MPFQGFGFGQQVGTVPPVNPLPSAQAITVWVDSVTGLDTNPGTQALPYQTLARAIAARRQYSVTLGTFLIRLMGAGPYAWPTDAGQLLNSMTLGAFIIQGDTAAETIHATGTFTGNLASGVLPTSAGLGVDTQKGRFLRITSGVAAGVESPIVINTDTSITPVTLSAFLSSGTIVNGDTFQIFSPGTSIGSPSFYNLQGGGPQVSGVTTPVICNTTFHRILLSSPIIVASTVNFLTCLISGTLNAYQSVIGTAATLVSAAILGLTTTQLASTGLIISSGTTSTLRDRSTFYGSLVLSNTGGSLDILSGSIVNLLGARLNGFPQVRDAGSQLIFAGIASPARGVFEISKTINVLDNGMVRIIGGTVYAIFHWAVTTGNCFTISRGGFFLWTSVGSLATGGTADAAGFAVSTKVGGRCFITNGAPTLTGGTLNKDLATTATPAGVANAVLAAAPSTVDALGSPYGEILARSS